MDLLPYFQWCYDTTLGETIRESTWLFPAIEAIHLLGFGVTIGAALMVDLRLLGVGLARQPPARLWSTARPWMIGGVIVLIVTGTLLFLSEAVKCYYSFPFWVKMSSLALVLLLTFTLQRRLVAADAVDKRPRLSRWIAIVSLCLWFGVAWGGRWIGFS